MTSVIHGPEDDLPVVSIHRAKQVNEEETAEPVEESNQESANEGDEQDAKGQDDS